MRNLFFEFYRHHHVKINVYNAQRKFTSNTLPLLLNNLLSHVFLKNRKIIYSTLHACMVSIISIIITRMRNLRNVYRASDKSFFFDLLKSSSCLTPLYFVLSVGHRFVLFLYVPLFFSCSFTWNAFTSCLIT